MKASMNIKMDEEIRDQAKALLGSMGLDMTTAINMFLRAVIREKALPFPVAAIPNQKTEDEIADYWTMKLHRAEEQIANGKFSRFEDFAAEMDRKYGLK